MLLKYTHLLCVVDLSFVFIHEILQKLATLSTHWAELVRFCDVHSPAV